MNKISYTYTNNMKQIFFSIFMLYFVLRLIVIFQIEMYKLEGYYENLMIIPSILLYLAIFAVILCILLGYKFFGSVYDENTLTYTNRITKRSKSIDLNEVKLAVFDKKNIRLYKTDDQASEAFVIPLFRCGISNAVDVDRFFRMMKDRNDVRVVKTFAVLPGYTKPWRILKIVYGFLAVAALFNLSTPLYTIIILFQNH